MTQNYILEKKLIEAHLRTAFAVGGIGGIRKILVQPPIGIFKPAQLAFLRSNGRVDEFMAPLLNNVPFDNWIEAASAAAAVCRPAYVDPLFLTSVMQNNDLIPYDADAQAIQYI